MNPAQVLQHGLTEVSNAQANSPVCVSLKSDYLIGTKEILKYSCIKMSSKHCVNAKSSDK